MSKKICYCGHNEERHRHFLQGRPFYGSGECTHCVCKEYAHNEAFEEYRFLGKGEYEPGMPKHEQQEKENKEDNDFIDSKEENVTTKMIKASCNSCGAGKKLYWFKETLCPCGGPPKPHTGKIVQEKTEIKPYLYVSTLEKGCPKCGGNLTKEDGL